MDKSTPQRTGHTLFSNLSRGDIFDIFARRIKISRYDAEKILQHPVVVIMQNNADF